MTAEPEESGAFLCRVEDVPDGGGITVDVAGTSAVLVRAGDAVYAFHNRCPHFGIPLEIGRGVKTFREHVLCVNHYAAFRFADGACVEGPCLGASLTAIPVDVANGRVVRVGTVLEG